ncbi:DNA-binding SARP family transcriptional activator [Micromonospora sp. M71_S20]|uniref:BTAD domain-containing putative transcriptional regulator n=1 Tax=Micromonospora sp. M71_S20 TaxID=592872 RepID=UPI000EAD7C9C|nr:BTAD domain-containing putative transcriptional regulator [Micromonospora sp. M71_S20]RLK24735.1 DNA-binding SARP family transcriptional activator [Micromonospora sp. M71_S20]
MRWPRRLAGAALVAAMLAIPPWLLATLTEPPLTSWPTSAQLRHWIADPLTSRTLTAGLTALAWLLWLGLAYTVAVTAAHRIRAGARWLRRLPLPTPWQAAATSVAGAAALTTAHTPTTNPPAPPAPAPVGGVQPHTADGAWNHTNAGVAVPGGWLPDNTAQQIATAAALVWLRRRRAYQPGYTTDEVSQLAPLPATVTAVQAAVADRQQPATTSSAAVPGLPGTGVAFTGDGAADAARGVLVTRLLTALRDPPPTTRVVITRAALTTLVPDITAVADSIPGLRVVDTGEEAVTLLSALSPPPAGLDGDTTMTPLVLVTNPASTATASQLTALAGHAHLVTLGAEPLGRTWHVDRHGHTRDDQTGQAEPRLCVLDQTAATHLLTVLAHPTPPLQDDTTEPTTPRSVDGGHLRIPRQPSRHTSHTTPQSPVPAPSLVQLRVLGQPALLVDGQPVTIRRSAALQVLVFLAVHPDGATTTQLVHAIWPGLPAHTVTRRLYTTLSDLRATIRAATTVAIIEHTDDRYRLDPDQIDVDLWRLHTAAHHAATTLTNHCAAWRAAIDAYTGDLADNHTWPWADPPREATRRLVIDAHTAAASAEPDPHQALKILQSGIRVDPYNEDLHRRAIDILTALGDHSAAVRLRDAYTRRLTLAGLRATDSIHQIPHASSGPVRL